MPGAFTARTTCPGCLLPLDRVTSVTQDRTGCRYCGPCAAKVEYVCPQCGKDLEPVAHPAR